MPLAPYIPVAQPVDLNERELLGPLGSASRSIARYDGLLQSLVNPQVLLSPLVSTEAVLSSRIEGTQATVEEVLEHDAGIVVEEGAKADDIQEVLNYRRALRLAAREDPTRAIRLNLILQLHGILMDGARGHNMAPGRFRTDQNWIGPLNSPIEMATYIPPAPLQLNDHLQAFEAYLEAEDRDPLIHCALMHAQFELLHPFKDGNGRIGRVLIPLFLFRKGALSSPMFYLSSYLERNRDEYCGRLQRISEAHEWTEWVLFFLRGVHEQSIENEQRVFRIRDLYTSTRERIREATRSQYAPNLTDGLFKSPAFSVSRIAEENGIPPQTAHNMVRQLIAENDPVVHVLREGAGRRAAFYFFPRLLRIAEGETE